MIKYFYLPIYKYNEYIVTKLCEYNVKYMVISVKCVPL